MKLALVIILFAQIAWNSAEKCTNGEPLKKKGIGRDDINRIVLKHNELRNVVGNGSVATQDPAQNMRTMSWDDELAAQAQKWAENCVFEHDPNLKNSKGEHVGQNLAIVYTTDENRIHSPDFPNMIQNWFDEVKEHGYENNGVYQPDSGHYSQVIWAKSNKVGCGYSAYPRDKHFVSLYLVCNYSPAGNYKGQLAYIPGKRNCKAHKLTDSTEFSGLCN